MTKAVVSLNVSHADAKRIAAAALADEATYLRRKVRKVKTGDPAADASRAIAGYLEQRSALLLLEAEQLDHL